jgi:hypothetical protein
VTITDVQLIVVAITNYCSACELRFYSSVFFLILPMDTFLIWKKARIDEESVSSASTSTLHVSENDAMNISVSNDTTVTITKSKADKVCYRK